MPLVKIGNNTCYYRLDGHADRPVLVFSHSLGLDHGMWDAQAAELLPYSASSVTTRAVTAHRALRPATTRLPISGATCLRLPIAAA